MPVCTREMALRMTFRVVGSGAGSAMVVSVTDGASALVLTVSICACWSNSCKS